jgi:protein phosphatase
LDAHDRVSVTYQRGICSKAARQNVHRRARGGSFAVASAGAHAQAFSSVMTVAASPPAPFEIDIAVLSDAGRRERNQDHCGHHLASRTQGIMAVADGSSPVEGGELASQRAVVAVLRTYRELPAGTSLTQRMTRAARNASFETYDLTVVVPQLREVSTTLTAVAVAAGQMTATHVGNGRVYLARGEALTQLSKDHTRAGEAAAEGRSYASPDGAQLTRSLGRELLAPIDVFEMELRRDDVVLICTDGLHAVLPDDTIARLARSGSAALACRQLVDEALRLGSPDSVSVGVIRMVGPT